MFRNERSYIIATVLWIYLLYGKPNELVEEYFKIVCLIFPLWVAGRYGAITFELIYNYVSEKTQCVIKSPFRMSFKRYIPVGIFELIRPVILAVIKTVLHLIYVIVMAKTYWYSVYFNWLKVGNVSISDLWKIYITFGMVHYLIIITVRMFCDSKEVAENFQPVN